MRTVVTVMMVALCVAATGAASPQAPITKTKSVSATATIQAIDATGRMITLKDETGVEDTYSVGPEVKRFNELKVGDTVKMTYATSQSFSSSGSLARRRLPRRGSRRSRAARARCRARPWLRRTRRR